MFGSVRKRLEALSTREAIAIAIATVVVLGAVDYATGSEISFSIFYLAPVVFVTWTVGRNVGIVFAVWCAAQWGVLDIVGGAHYSNDLIPVWNSLVRLGFFVITLWLADDLRRAQERAETLARHDPLTGVLNGREFAFALELEIGRARRSHRPLALAYLDLDRFKSVNDTLGHSVGDELLRVIAAAIDGCVRTTDVVARLGGDEFAVLLPETDDIQAGATIARLRTAIDGAIAEVAPSVRGVGFTMGVVIFADVPVDGEDAIRIADTVMYEGKNAGRGRVELRHWSTAKAGVDGGEVTLD